MVWLRHIENTACIVKQADKSAAVKIVIVAGLSAVLKICRRGLLIWVELGGG